MLDRFKNVLDVRSRLSSRSDIARTHSSVKRGMILKRQSMSVVEGYAPFKHPSLTKECSTWYQIHGDLNRSSSGCPLVVLHGGPGSNHNYLLSLKDLAQFHGIPIIFYDQIGGGKSTHLREKRLDEAFWTVDLFVAELQNLIEYLGIKDQFDLLGQSWGGLLAISFASSENPLGLRKLVVSNSPASLNLWLKACNQYRQQLPPKINQVLEKYEQSQDFSAPEYKDACMVWYKLHMCRSDPWPQYVIQSFEITDEDDTVYYTMNGPSEFTVIGSLRSFSIEGQLQQVRVPTLILNGEFDAANLEAVTPFLTEIPNVTLHTFPDCSHMCHVEDRSGYMEIVGKFLTEKR